MKTLTEEEGKKMDEYSKHRVNLYEEVAELKADVELLKRTNNILADAVKELSERLEQFTKGAVEKPKTNMDKLRDLIEQKNSGVLDL